MIVTYKVYEVKDNWSYDSVSSSNIFPISKQFDTPDEAVNFIKTQGSFSSKYTVLPIYEVTIDDINERYD